MENEEQTVVCKLCLKPCECFEDIEAVAIEMLGLLGLELDSNISGKRVICKPCSENLQKCFDFKTVCLYTEDCINSFRDNRDNVKLNLHEIYLRKNENENITVSKCHTVCRLCMEIAESGCCISLNEETLSAKATLGKYFSQLDLEITKNPVICTSCNESLHCYFSFINSGLGMKDKVKRYCEIEASSNKSQVRSNSVLPFEVENTSNDENGSNGIDIRQNCNEGALYDGIKLKTENQMQKESQELHIKCEPNEHEEVDDVKAERLSDIEESCHGREYNSEPGIKCKSLVGIEDDGLNIKHEEIEIKIEDEGTARIRNNSPKRHMVIHKTAPGVTVYSCKMCTYNTKRKSSLKQHMLIHKNALGIAMYSCETCTYKTKRKGDLQRHILIHKHSSEKTVYSCELCTHKTKQKRRLQLHMLLHKNSSDVRMYSCETCTYKTKRKGDLQRHMLIHKSSSELTMYACEICTHKTKQKSCLQLHMLIHKSSSEITMYSCDTCTFETKWKSVLKQHMLIHKNASEVTGYSCGICTYKAKWKNSLRRHMLIHKDASEVAIYSCTICPYKTKQKSYLRQHNMLKHTNASEIKTYSCETCPYKAKRKYHLRQHMLIHKNASEVTMYSCEICTYQTRHKSNLKLHMVIHKNASEITMYPCKMCTYETKQKGQLRQHMLIHKDASEERCDGNTDTSTDGSDSDATNKEISDIIRQDRKRKRKENQQNLNKELRNKGQKYHQKRGKGKQVEAAVLGPNCNCKWKCFDKVSTDLRTTLFKAFWNLSDFDIQNSYLFGRMKTSAVSRPTKQIVNSPSRRSYSVKYSVLSSDASEITVCKKAFLSIHGLHNHRGRIENLVQKKTRGGYLTSPLDQRGAHGSHPKKYSEDDIKQVNNFIDKLPKYESHYNRNKAPNKMYMGMEYTIQICYNKYIDECKRNNRRAVSKDKFYRIFTEEHNIGFKTPKTDTCSLCDSLKISLQKANLDEDEQRRLMTQKELHLRKAQKGQDYVKDVGWITEAYHEYYNNLEEQVDSN